LKRIAIFASGAGSNAQKIIEKAGLPQSSAQESGKSLPIYKVSLIVCNKPGAGVIRLAAKENIPVLMIEKDPFFRGEAYVGELKAAGIDYIILAGFLWKIPLALIAAYPNKIINIHPALLPKYGGKGMYGMHVHKAVVENQEAESGITIHYVDELYDHGQIIFQATCPVYKEDTADTLAQRIHALEHLHFPAVIADLMQ
jgi:phosphoribosylglycinamide formyltransferase-1